MMLTCSIDVDVLLNTSDCHRYIIRKIREISGQKKETSKYVSFALRREQDKNEPSMAPHGLSDMLNCRVFCFNMIQPTIFIKKETL